MDRRHLAGRVPDRGGVARRGPGGGPGPGGPPFSDSAPLHPDSHAAHPVRRRSAEQAVTLVPPVPPGRPEAARPARATLNDRLLNACDGPQGSTPLHEEVGRNLQHLWSYGNNRDGKTPGRRPDWILIRPPF